MTTAHMNSASGQQFHVRYDYTYDNGTTQTLWGRVHDNREMAERDKSQFLKWGYANVEIFVRNVSPWRQDVPGACRCGCPENEHRWITEVMMCDDHECTGYQP